MGKTRSKVHLGRKGAFYYTQTRHSSIASTCIQVIDVPYMSQRKYVVREERERERQRGGLADLD